MGLRVAKFITKQLQAANHVVEVFGNTHHLQVLVACVCLKVGVVLSAVKSIFRENSRTVTDVFHYFP